MLSIIEATTENHFSIIRHLFKEYETAIGIDLSFQQFDDELKTLPGKYAAPDGALFIAMINESPVGCVAFRPFEIPGIAELKRLFVRPEARGKNIGEALSVHAIEAAKNAGYSKIRLDTLPAMQSAQKLYIKLGFKEIPPYRFNPVAGAKYFELELPSIKNKKTKN
jgi:ribosomal protein S18 acetylase RimI-like enzyme